MQWVPWDQFNLEVGFFGQVTHNNCPRMCANILPCRKACQVSSFVHSLFPHLFIDKEKLIESLQFSLLVLGISLSNARGVMSHWMVMSPPGLHFPCLLSRGSFSFAGILKRSHGVRVPPSTQWICVQGLLLSGEQHQSRENSLGKPKLTT